MPKALDTSKFQQAPCTVLTPGQLQALGMTKQREAAGEAPTGPSCDWPDDEGFAKVRVSVTLAVKAHGLTGMYANRSTFAVFEPVNVDGYPAVIALQVDQRKSGRCSVLVGVTDQLFYGVQLQFNTGVDKPADFANPCGRAQQVAAEVLKTLKGGG